MKIAKAFPLALFLISGCAVHHPESQTVSDARECAKNFTYNGGSLKGTVFRTHEILSGIDKYKALKNTANYIVLEGWSITNTDDELGILSATDKGVLGERNAAPLNISFTPNDEGLSVVVSFATAAVSSSPADRVMNSFCDMIASARM